MTRRDIWAAVLAVLLVPAAVDAGEKPKEEEVEGYAEWRQGACLIVDGQRVCPGPNMEFEGKDAAVDYDSIPLGYEVKAKGVRNAEGALIATKLEAKANGMAMFEDEVVKGTNAAEAAYRRVGHMFEQVDEDSAVDFGVLHETGPKVARVRRITDRLLPPHVDTGDVRVYVVDNPEWNAMAMGNYSIYVFSGLLDDMDDDEVAIVLGLVNEQVENENANAIIELVGQFGALAWQNGYGRGHEDQADRVGLRYAYEAGFDISKDEVLALLGRPSDRMSFGRKARWVYQDMTVVFEGGRVTTVRF